MKHIKSLIINDWIEELFGPWGSVIVLAAKPRQDHTTNIKYFIWIMCTCYRKLNSITKSSEYSILQYGNDVTTVMTGSSVMWIITVYVRQVYHQISVKIR